MSQYQALTDEIESLSHAEQMARLKRCSDEEIIALSSLTTHVVAYMNVMGEAERRGLME